MKIPITRMPVREQSRWIHDPGANGIEVEVITDRSQRVAFLNQQALITALEPGDRAHDGND